MTTAIVTIPTANLATIATVPTVQDILNERVNQIDLFGSATAHSVKKALRAQGLTTTQAEVSETLKANKVPEIGASFNGKYLTYFAIEPSDVKILPATIEVLMLN
jgi:hypothetical protein